MSIRSSIAPILSAALCLTLAAPAAAETGGFFRKGEIRQEYRHAIALARESPTHPGKQRIRVYLTTHPVDAVRASREFDLDDGVTDQLQMADGGMTRFVIGEDDEARDVRFWVKSPSADFSSSGYGELSLGTRSATQVEGRFVLAEPESFFSETYEFDLRFAAPVTPADLGGDPLPAGGGEAGKAWLGYVQALGKGDLDALRNYFGEDAEWTLPKGDEEASKSYVEMLRWSAPASATVTRGWTLDKDRALLRIEGRSRLGDLMRGEVLMSRAEGRWKEARSDLAVVGE